MKKEELIKDKWYKVTSYFDLYYKFDYHIDNSSIRMSLYREGRMLMQDYPASNNEFWLKAVEATIEELKTFLPPNHPDLIQYKTYELW
jgi:hypothetical protein